MTLRLAVAGAGLIGRAHARRIRARTGCTLAGLADPSPGAAAWAAECGLAWYASLSELLAAQQPDGVILATPNALHVDGALQCLAAGVPCLVEKPLADSVAQGQRLVDAQRASGVPVLVGHHRRHRPLIGRAAEVVASGRLGRLVAITGSATFAKPASYFSEAPWRSQPGGGPILINLVHEIDNLRALVGDIVQVQAMAANAVRGGAVEDTVVIGLRFAHGALGSFVLSDAAASPCSWEQTSAENSAYDHHPDQDCYVIAGTRGTLMLPTMRLFECTAEPSWWAEMQRTTVPTALLDPLQRQLDHFCAVVRREVAPLVGAADALATLRTTVAVAEAAHQGRTVSLA